MKHDQPKIYAILSIVAIWTCVSLWLRNIAVPTPWATAEQLVALFFDKLLPHSLMSYMRLFVAITLASILGGIIGIICGMYSRIGKYIMPIIDVFYPIPRIAFLPLFLIAFGLGEVSKIMVIMAVAIFYFIIPIYAAVRQIPQQYHVIARTLDLTQWQWFQHVILPAILPDFFTALKLTVGASMAALFFAENVASTSGIAYYIMNAWSFSNYPAMYAGLIVLCVMGGLLFKVLDLLEKWLTPWLQ